MRLTGLEALALFPYTSHVETAARFDAAERGRAVRAPGYARVEVPMEAVPIGRAAEAAP